MRKLPRPREIALFKRSVPATESVQKERPRCTSVDRLTRWHHPTLRNLPLEQKLVPISLPPLLSPPQPPRQVLGAMHARCLSGDLWDRDEDDFDISRRFAAVQFVERCVYRADQSAGC
jgi:hypothetical protein